MDKMMDNVQKHNTCNNIPLSQTFKVLKHEKRVNVIHWQQCFKFHASDIRNLEAFFYGGIIIQYLFCKQTAYIHTHKNSMA
jgi:hypothetical protein